MAGESICFQKYNFNHIKKSYYLHIYEALNCKVITALNVNLYTFYDVDFGFVVSLILLNKSHLTFKSCLSDICTFQLHSALCSLFKKIEDNH